MFRWICAAGAACFVSSQAQSQDWGSEYSRIDDCASHQAIDGPGVEEACLGLSGWSVFIASGEHGSAIAYAHEGGELSDYLNPPMRGLFGGFHDVIEWRSWNGAAPTATIHRYVTETPTGEVNASGEQVYDRAETLVVTALRPDEYGVIACHVAYIDATGMTRANEAARLAADGLAADFDCEASESYDFEGSIEDVEEAIENRPDHL